MTAAPGAPPASSAPTQLRLRLEGFDGPLELLLSLVESRALPITRVSLASVADQYLAHVHALPRLDPDLLAEFLSIGGKLLLLKSRALLLSDEPDPVVEETAAELQERLEVYRVFRAAAEVLRDLERQDRRTYPRREVLQASPPPAPLAPTSLEALATAMRRLSVRQPSGPADFPLQPRVSVEERRDAILQALGRAERLSFWALAGTTTDEVIASFLAILELFRRGVIWLRQANPFGDVLITPAESSPTPS